MVERILHRLLDDALRLGGGEAVLGLALEFRLADEDRQHAAGADHDVVAGDGGGAFLLVDARGVVLQPAQQRRAQAGFMRAAVRRRNGVAVGVEEAVGVGGPGDRPLHRAMGADFAVRAGKDVRMHQRRILELVGQIVLQALLEMEGGLLGHVLDALEQRLVAMPADFDAAEQISLRARHLEDALGHEGGLGSENLRIGPESNLGAAPVGRAAGFFQLALRLAALERHAIELLLARDLDLHALGQRIGNRHADAVQAARRFVDFRVEFAAGVQRAHDHFQRRLVLELGMRVDRDAAAVVGDGDEAVGLHLDFDPVGVPGQRLVHRIVDHFGEQMMQRLFVGAADIHAGAAAHRLQALQHLDVLGGVAALGGGGFARGRLRRLARSGFARACFRRPFGGVEQVALNGRLFLGRGFGHEGS